MGDRSRDASTDIYSLVPFNWYSEGWPRGVQRGVADAVGSFSQLIQSSAPSGVTWVVAWPRRPWKYANKEVLLYVLGSFDSRYDLIKGLAKSLSGAFSKLLILPTVVPITRAEWERQVETRSIRYRRIRARGMLLYDSTRKSRI